MDSNVVHTWNVVRCNEQLARVSIAVDRASPVRPAPFDFLWPGALGSIFVHKVRRPLKPERYARPPVASATKTP